MRALRICLAQVSTVKVGSGEVSALQICKYEFGSYQLRVLQVRALKVESGQVLATPGARAQVRTGEVSRLRRGARRATEAVTVGSQLGARRKGDIRDQAG